MLRLVMAQTLPPCATRTTARKTPSRSVDHNAFVTWLSSSQCAVVCRAVIRLASHGSAGRVVTVATDIVSFVLQTGSSTERRNRQTEGPTTWAEVDTEEIERVAVNIARNAMPSNAENTELASRLEAQVGRRTHQHAALPTGGTHGDCTRYSAVLLTVQAAALEADNNDILGLGQIDTQSLALVRWLSSVCASCDRVAGHMRVTCSRLIT